MQQPVHHQTEIRLLPYWWSSSALVLSVIIIALASILALPVFPNQRTSNISAEYFGIVLYTICCTFLIYEIRAYRKIAYICKCIQKSFRTLVQWTCAKWKKICYCRRIFGRCNNGLPVYNRFNASNCNSNNLEAYEFEHTPLAYVFFVTSLVLQVWAILDECIVMTQDPICFHPGKLTNNILKLIFAILLMIAICFKTDRSRDTGLSYFRWSIIGAGSYSCVLNYLADEVSLGYIDVVEEAFHMPEYAATIGLNISGYHHAEDYLELIFRLKAHCLKSVLSPKVTEVVLDLIPTAAEYFSMAIFFCVVTWKRLRVQPCKATHIVSRNTMVSNLTAIRPLGFLSQTFAYSVSIMFIALTAGSFCTFRFKFMMDPATHRYGFWLFHVQQLTLEIVVFMAELIFHLKYLRNSNFESEPPTEFQLDILLLIFPLLPLAIINFLRIIPYILAVDGIQVRAGLTVTMCCIVLFQYLQLSFQAVFISEIFCRLYKQGEYLAGAKYFFRMLMCLNFCIWFSVSFELKSLIFHDSVSFQIYGIWLWVIVAYATVPFVIFCYAHVTSCFYEIGTHVAHAHVTDSTATNGSDVATSDIESNTSLIVRYKPNKLYNLTLFLRDVKQNMLENVLRTILTIK